MMGVALSSLELSLVPVSPSLFRRGIRWLRCGIALAALSVIPLWPATAAAGLSVGDHAPALSLPTADGGEFQLKDELRKHAVLLEFVSLNCKPCLESQPWVDHLLAGLGEGKHVGLVSVLFGKDAGASGGLKEDQRPLETRLHGDEAVAQTYGVYGTPVFLLVSKRGTVVWKHVGRLTSGAAERAVDAAIADGAVASASPAESVTFRRGAEYR